VRTRWAVLLILLAGLIATGGAAAVAQERPGDAPPKKPNILFILTDDQDVDSLSEMPNVQARLAGEGTTFSQAFATTPLCCPSRASILRGQYAHNHGVFYNHYPDGGFERFRELGLENSTVATWLDSAGYQTGYIGKYLNEYGSYDEPTTHIPAGWDRWVGFQSGRDTLSTQGVFKVNDQGEIVTVDAATEMDTDYFARKAEAFIRDQTARTPWFLVVATNAPHGPALASERNDGTYSGRTMPRTPSFNEADVSDKAAIWRDKPLLTDECPPDHEDSYVPQCTPEVDEVWRDRMESLLDVDDMVGRLDRALRDKDFLRNTYVVYTSDNGFAMFKNRVYGKGAPYEYSQKVPFIIRGPGVVPGHVDDRLVANIDLAPTFADWAGGALPGFVDGRSLTPVLDDPANLAPWRTRLLFEYRHDDLEYQAVRTDTGRVYIEYPLTHETEYYDLRTDPYQRHSTAQRPPQLREQLEDLASCSGAECREADGGPHALDEKYTAVCQNIVSQVANVTDSQNAAAAALAITTNTGNSEVVVKVAQSQGVSVSQINQCLNLNRASVDWDVQWRDWYSHPADYWLRRYLSGD
jgi:N-acetylglucosamine-6-sulfatase